MRRIKNKKTTGSHIWGFPLKFPLSHRCTCSYRNCSRVKSFSLPGIRSFHLHISSYSARYNFLFFSCFYPHNRAAVYATSQKKKNSRQGPMNAGTTPRGGFHLTLLPPISPFSLLLLPSPAALSNEEKQARPLRFSLNGFQFTALLARWLF
jgi:hypothetical protein